MATTPWLPGLGSAGGEKHCWLFNTPVSLRYLQPSQQKGEWLGMHDSFCCWRVSLNSHLKRQHGLLLLAQAIKVTIVSPCFGGQGPLQASSCHPHMPLYSRGRRCLPTVKMRQLVKLSFWKITYCSPLINSFPLSMVKVFNFAYSRLKYIVWLEHGDYISSHHHGNCFSSHYWDLWRV